MSDPLPEMLREAFLSLQNEFYEELAEVWQAIADLAPDDPPEEPFTFIIRKDPAYRG